MKTPEEIKDSLRVCASDSIPCNCCLYYGNGCRSGVAHDVLAYINQLESLLEKQPKSPIATEPMRHGRWKSIAGFTACSECGSSPADWEPKSNNPMGLPPYCHSCGAKMDGGVDA